MFDKQVKPFFALILAMLMGASSFAVVYSQSMLNLQIEKVNEDKFPLLDVYVSVSDERNASVSNLNKNNFSIAEAGAPVSIFEISPVYEKPLAVVLAIDISVSMSYGQPVSALAASVAQARDLVSALGSEDQVAVVAFSDKFTVVQELTTDRNKALLALDDLRVEKNASIYQAIAESALLLDNFSGRRAVIMFTDSANAGFGGYTLDQALNIAVQKKVTFLPIYWNDTSKQEMSKLASLTNGKAFGLGANQPGEQDFKAAINEIKNLLRGLREQYLLRYTSSLPATGSEQELVVKVDYQGAHAEQARKFMPRGGSVSVNLKNLVDGQSVAGKVEIVPEVTAPGTISRLEVFVDDKLLDTVSGEPFKYIWDTSQISAGNHSLKTIITDSAGNAGSTLLNLVINVPISVTILAPAADAVIDRSVSIESNVVSAKPVTYVEIILDKQVIQKIDAPASFPLKYEFNPATTSAGKHQITVKAYNSEGFSAEATISVNIAPEGGSGAWIAILAVLALAGILIPLGLRSRRKRQLTMNASDPDEPEPTPVENNNKLAVLQEIEGANPGKVWSLDRDETSLGRKSTENDIPLKGIGASRHHAVIRCTSGQTVLIVRNLENPVLVNQRSVTGQKILEPGDILQAGESIFRFEA